MVSIQATTARRREIAAIVARESVDTLVGRMSGIRVAAARALLRPMAHVVAGRFAEYDRVLGEAGPHRGSRHIVGRETGGLVVRGSEHVPASGPLLVVANHPGLTDAVALLAALGRDDAWVVAAEYPFLRALRQASRRFIFVGDGHLARRSALRRIVAHLRLGETVLLFPAGGLEPDPAVGAADARQSVDTWSASIGLIARLARGTTVLPAAVVGAVSRVAFDHPFAKRRSSTRERQRMAALLQIAFSAFQKQQVCVRFGEAIPYGTPDVHGRVMSAMGVLIAAP